MAFRECQIRPESDEWKGRYRKNQIEPYIDPATSVISIMILNGNYRGSRVNIRLHLVFPISPLLLIGFWTYLELTESHSPGESNAIGFKKFGAELAEDVG